MKCFIPLATGSTIPREVYTSLGRQTVDIDIIPCVSDGIQRGHQAWTNRKKVACELTSRNIITKILIVDAITDKYVMVQDRDIEQLYADNVANGARFLDENTGYAAIAFSGLKAGHVCHQSAIFRTDFLRGYTWNLNFCKTHICTNLKKDIETEGFEYGYFPSTLPLIKEIGNV